MTKIKTFVISLYTSHRVLLKEVVSSFTKAFLSVLIPAVLGILSDLSKLGTGGHIHLSFLLSVVVAAVVGAVYAGVHATSLLLSDKLKTKVGLTPVASVIAPVVPPVVPPVV